MTNSDLKIIQKRGELNDIIVDPTPDISKGILS